MTPQANMQIKNLVVKQFDAHGVLIQSLKTPLMQHVSSTNQHEFQFPELFTTQNQQNTLTITADHASMKAKDQNIVLSKNVVVQETPKTASSPTTTLSTEELMYFPKKQWATTPKHVMIKNSQGHVIEALGMKADIAKQKIHFLHQTQGIYVPKTKG